MKTHYSWMIRSYLSCSVAATAVIALVDPTSQHRLAIEGGDPILSYGAVIAMVGLLLVAALSLIDVVINDLLPERFSIGVTHRYRHILFMLMSISQAALAWMMIHGLPEPEWALLRYAVDGIAAAGVAVWGVRDHYFRRVDAYCVREGSAGQ
jgi:hypothetical protein